MSNNIIRIKHLIVAFTFLGIGIYIPTSSIVASSFSVNYPLSMPMYQLSFFLSALGYFYSAYRQKPVNIIFSAPFQMYIAATFEAAIQGSVPVVPLLIYVSYGWLLMLDAFQVDTRGV